MSRFWSQIVAKLSPYVPGEQRRDVAADERHFAVTNKDVTLA